MNDRVKRLEEKIAYLERHVTEQDKVMLELADDLAAVRRELKTLRDRSGASSGGDAAEGGSAADERPPHY